MAGCLLEKAVFRGVEAVSNEQEWAGTEDPGPRLGGGGRWGEYTKSNDKVFNYGSSVYQGLSKNLG